MPPALAGLRKAELRLLGSDVRFLDRREDRDEFGSPIHGSVDGDAVVRAARGLTGRLRDLRAAGLTVKAAYTVLHTYAQSCCNHLQRANYEQGPWVEALEGVLQEALGELVGAELGATQRAVASLRLKEGGLAFGGLGGRSAPAFLASWAACLEHVASQLGASSWEGFRSRCPTLSSDLDRAERDLRLAGGNGSRPLDWTGWFGEADSGLQGVWGREASACKREALLRDLGDEDAADLRSHGGPGAGSFLLPAQASIPVIPGKHFKVALQDRLLLLVCEEGAHCQHRRSDGTVCGAPLDCRGHHARKCSVGGALGKRHDRIRHHGAGSLAACTGLPASTEQRVPEWDRDIPHPELPGQTVRQEAVLDIVSSDPVTGEPVHVDVTVTTACPEDRADLRGRARHDGRGAAAAAADKRRRYNLAGASLVPMAFEDGGRACEETASFVRRCGAAAEQRGVYGAEGGQSATARLWQEYSTLLQIGNAELVLSANGR